MSPPAPEPRALYPLNDLELEVIAQTRQFEAALPELLATHAGEWAVWLDGLRGLHDTHDEALAWAYDNLPEARGWAIVEVAPRRPVSLSGAAAFGL